jgi:predicted RNase H-like nuclease (RuvC/YqgF family)
MADMGVGPLNSIVIAAIGALGGTFLTEAVKQWVVNNQSKRDSEVKFSAQLLDRITALEARADTQRKDNDDRYDKQRQDYERRLEELRAKVDALETANITLKVQLDIATATAATVRAELERTKEQLLVIDERCNREHAKIVNHFKTPGQESE